MTSEQYSLIGAVVVGWNHRDDSAECIRSILSSGYPSLKVWFVDNGSTDGSPAFLRQQFQEITVIELGSNQGLAEGYNGGVDAALRARVQYVCVLNNDVAVVPGVFQALLVAVSLSDRVGLVIPKIVLYSNENVVWSAGARKRRFPPGIVQRGIGASSSDERFSKIQPVGYATSCAWLMNAAMVPEVGLFDPAYPFYYSDNDYCERVTRHGWKILYTPRAVVKHKVSLSTQKGSKPVDWWRDLGEAEARFYRQYGTATQLILHAGWIVVRSILQGNARFIPAYVQGLRHARNP